MASAKFDGVALPSEAAVQAAQSCRRAAAELGAFVEIRDPRPSHSTGSIAGLPFAVKDMFDLACRPPTLGLIRAPREIPGHHAKVLSVLLDAGAELVAFTQMTPLAYEPSGANPQRGRPKNPWSDQHICGGSSSGSAVAVAAGCVPLAIGSDTAGSLRIPAHCCGITAWKPTFGLVPIDGAMALAPSLDTVGLLARTAADILPVVTLFSGSSQAAPVKRVAVARDLVAAADVDVRDALAGVERVLEGIGSLVGSVHLEPLRSAADPPLLILLQGEPARAHADLITSGLLDDALVRRFAKGAAISDGEIAEARDRLEALRKTEIARLFSTFDAILLPVMPLTTPLADVCEPSSPAFSARTLYELSRFTRFVNALGLPAVALPVGFDRRGLPVGAQLIGPPGADLGLLSLVRQIQDASTWHMQSPASPDQKHNVSAS